MHAKIETRHFIFRMKYAPSWNVSFAWNYQKDQVKFTHAMSTIFFVQKVCCKNWHLVPCADSAL